MMKIPTSIRTLHDELSENYSRLLVKVDEKISNFKAKGWHYESRIKESESFALKIETGRCLDPKNMEDFFGCTLVVENLNAVAKAENLIKSLFELYERRPDSSTATTKPSDSFRFDDLRLYVKWRDDKDSKPTGLEGMPFEVQIKTFLQHAWSIATHDLIYKSDEKEWSKERIAFQVKAMLEHAETSIQEAETLAKSDTLQKTYKKSQHITDVINLLNELWLPSALPEDKKRLAENINNLIHAMRIDISCIRLALKNETEEGRGTNTLSLSPYAVVIQTLFNQMPEEIISYLTKPKNKFKVYLHKELELPVSIDRSKLINTVG